MLHHQCVDLLRFFFPPTPRCDRNAGLLSACLIYASGQIWVKIKNPPRWLPPACSSFAFLHSLCTFFFSKLVSVRLRVSGAPGCECVCVFACVFWHDETWQVPSSSPQTQHSTMLRYSLRVARFSSFHCWFSPSSPLLLPFSLLFFFALTGGKRQMGEWKRQDSN